MKNPAPSGASPNGLPILTAWETREVSHGFAGRAGGVSIGAYQSLNLAYWVGDSRAAVGENWRRMRAVIGEHTPVARVKQVHGNLVRVVTGDNASTWPKGDGMVTAEAGIVLGIMTADCVPILMMDLRRRIIGAIHAGWRGIIAGIADGGVSAMQSLGAHPAQIRAALGPSIGQCCFEVDADLADRFTREIDGAGRHRRPGRPGKAYLDLRAIVTDQLAAAGLARESIISAGPCTRCANDRYFSRRAVGSATSGLQLSFIGIRSHEETGQA